MLFSQRRKTNALRAKRRLTVESLESRRLLTATLTVNPTNATIYEDISSYGQPQSQSFNVSMQDPDGGFWMRTFVTINGQIDSYSTAETPSDTPTSNQRKYQLSANPSFTLYSAQDESTPISIDTNDYEDDVLSIEFIGEYCTTYPSGSCPAENVRTTAATSASLTIIDIDETPETATIELSTTNSTAVEPHNIYYLPHSPADIGQFKFLFPTQWNGGWLDLSVAGSTATYNVDYVFGIQYVAGPAGTQLTGTAPNLSLFVPKDVTDLRLSVTALGDLTETDPGETVSLTFNPSTQVFTGEDNSTITVSGSASLTIHDELEGLKIVAQPGETEEYRVDPTYAAFAIRPDNASAQMRGSVFLRIDASANNAATPGIDYALHLRGSTSPLVLTQIGTSQIYETNLFSVNGLTELFVDVFPVDDRVLEGDEQILVTLMSPPRYSLPSPDSGNHGDATVTIKEDYYDTEKEADPSPDPDSTCSCSCSCPGSLKIEPRDGSMSISDMSGQTQYFSEDQDSQNPVLRIKLALPDGKAVPTQVDVVVQTIRENLDMSGNPIGLGRQKVSEVFTASILIQSPIFTESNSEDRFIWIVVQPDLSESLASWAANASSSGAQSTGANQGIINLEILAHPVFPASASTAERFSGWVGRHSHLFTDKSKSGIVGGHAPGLTIPGIDRAIPDAWILVPKVGGNGRSDGAVERQNGFALFRSDGSTSWFKNGSTPPPNTLSTLSGSTLTKRDNSRDVFNAQGRLMQQIDPQGNVTNITYDGYGRVATITDPFSRVTTFAYQEGAATAAAQADRVVVTDWEGRASTLLYNRATQSLTVTHTDPDGAGARQSLVETWAYSSGLLASISYRAADATGSQRTMNFGYDYNPTGTGQSRGTRRLTSVSRTDGSAINVTRSSLHEAVVLPQDSSAPVPINADIALRKTFRDETVIEEVVNAVVRATVYKLAPGGFVIERLDPEQTAKLYPNGVPTSPPTAQELSLRSALSYRFDITPPTRDPFGNISGSASYLELANTVTTPDPDLVVSGFTTVSDGPRVQQSIAQTFANGNRTSITRPGLPAQPASFNETFDIATSTADENGNTLTRVVDAYGLVTSEKWSQIPAAWQNQVDQYDVDSSGFVSAQDANLILNFLSANGNPYVIPHPAPPPIRFYDVNGDGIVGSLDALLVTNEASRRNQGQPPSPPPVQVVLSQRDLTFSAPGAGLPRGLVTQERIVTGRASGDIVTNYEYINTSNSPGATLAQRGKLLRKIVAPDTAEQAITNYAYDAGGNLSQITDPLGRVTKFFYDSLDRLTATLGPDPDGSGPLLGLATRFDYDVFGNIVATETINSYLDTPSKALVTATKTFTIYNGIDLPTVQYSQNPSVTWYLYPSGTAVAQTSSKTTAAGAATLSSTQLEAYLSDNLIIINTPNVTANQGLSTATSYNGAGEVTSVTETASGTALSPRVTSFSYDRLGRVTEVLSPDHVSGLIATPQDRKIGNRFLTNFSYDNVGNLLQTTDPLGNITSQAYDDLNRIVSQTLPHATVNGAAGATTVFEYTATRFGWDIESTNSEGQVVTTRTDAFGRTTAVSGDTPAKTWVYWSDGALASEEDSLYSVTLRDYTLRGQLKSITQPTADDNSPSPVTSYTYYADGQVKDVTDPLSRSTTYYYLSDGQVGTISYPDPDGAGIQLPTQVYFRYDAAGNLRRTWDTLSNNTLHDYDSLFRRISTTDARNSTTHTAYTLYDEVASVTDSLNNVTTYIYNGVGQLVTERQLVSGVNRDRSFSYDGAGNLLRAADRNGRVRNFAYNHRYQNTAETWTVGSTQSRRLDYTHDSLGNLLSVQDTSVHAPDFVFTYDDRNQIQLEQQSYFPGISSLIIDRNYDDRGNRTRTAVNIGGTLGTGTPGSGGTISGGMTDFTNNYSYDRLNRLTSVNQSGFGGSTSNAVASKHAAFSYDVASQMTDLRRYSSTTSDPANLEIHSRYAFDNASRLTSVTHARTEIAAGQVWNGTATLPASITPASTIAAYAFAYDRDNRMTSLASYADRFTATYVHDAVDQLTSASYSAIAGLAAPSPMPANETYSTDSSGNRTGAGGVSQSTSGTHNRLQTDGTYNYLYDNEGNVTRRTLIATGAITEYVWDHRNRLTNVIERTAAGGTMLKRTVYEYDAFGRRVMDYYDRDGNGVYDQIDRWFNDGTNRLLQIRDSDGQGTAQGFRISNRYLHGDETDRVIADEQYANGTGPVYSATTSSAVAGTTLWAVADHLGSARDLVDNNGIVRKHVVFDSFGKRSGEVNRDAAGTVLPALSASAVDTAFGYTGADWDGDVGLTNHDARWHDSGTGRWLSQDPIGFEAGDPNLYRYVGNTPTTKTDPSGLAETIPLIGPDGKPYTVPPNNPYNIGTTYHQGYLAPPGHAWPKPSLGTGWQYGTGHTARYYAFPHLLAEGFSFYEAYEGYRWGCYKIAAYRVGESEFLWAGVDNVEYYQDLDNAWSRLESLLRAGRDARMVLLETARSPTPSTLPDGRLTSNDLLPPNGPLGYYDFSTLLWDNSQRQYCWESIHDGMGNMWRSSSPRSKLPHRTFIVVEITPERAQRAGDKLPTMPWTSR